MASRKRVNWTPHVKGILGMTNFGLPVVEYSGKPRVLGCLPPLQKTTLPDWHDDENAAVRSLVPTQWVDRDYRTLIDKILDQAQSSACTGFATRQAYNVSYQLGARSDKSYDFSPYFPYGLVNNGVDQGAVISNILEEMLAKGICLNGDIQPGAMFANQFPASAFKSALRFRILRAIRCATFEDFCSAIASGFVGIYGILIGQNFDQLDSEGAVPAPDVVRGGHALAGIGLKRLKSGRVGVLTVNSWGRRFGMDGYCYVTKELFDQRIDAYAIQAASLDASVDRPPATIGMRSHAPTSRTRQRAARGRKSVESLLAA